MEQTRIYPLEKQTGAKPMQFPDASGVPVNMLMPHDSSAFDMLQRFIGSEYADTSDMDMRGVLEAIGIVKGQSFSTDSHARQVLSYAGQRATDIGHYISYVAIASMPGGMYYKDRQYINGCPPVPANPTFSAPTYTDLT